MKLGKQTHQEVNEMEIQIFQPGGEEDGHSECNSQISSELYDKFFTLAQPNSSLDDVDGIVTHSAEGEPEQKENSNEVPAVGIMGAEQLPEKVPSIKSLRDQITRANEVKRALQMQKDLHEVFLNHITAGSIGPSGPPTTTVTTTQTEFDLLVGVSGRRRLARLLRLEKEMSEPETFAN